MGILEIFHKDLNLDNLDVAAITAFRKKKEEGDVHKKPRYLDFHCDTLTKIKKGNLYENKRDIDLTRAFEVTSQYVQMFAIFQNMGKVKDGEYSFDDTYAKVRGYLKQAAPYIRFCRTGAELKDAVEAHRAAALLSVEDISQMGDQADQCRELGICSAMLTWNYENQYGCGAAVNQQGRLTPDGISLAERLLEQGVILDVSHLSDAGVDDLFRLTEKPIIASHSNVRDIKDHPRNLTKTHIREIIARGGIIGMNLLPLFIWEDEHKGVTLSDLRRHMDYILEEGGENCLAMGGDLDGTSGRFPENFHGIQSLPALYEELVGAGYGAELVDKILFKNGYEFLVRNLE